MSRGNFNAGAYGNSDFFKSIPNVEITDTAHLRGGVEKSVKLSSFSAPLMTREDIGRAVRGTLGLQDSAEAFSLQDIALIDRLFEGAKVFHQRVLRMDLPEEVQSRRITSSESIYKLVEDSFYLNPRNYETGPSICALIKIATIMHYAESKQYNDLDLKMTSFEGDFLDSFPGIEEHGSSKRVNIYGEEFSFEFCSRRKKFDRLMLKIAKTPDFSLDKVTDGIGVRILVKDQEQLLALVEYCVRSSFGSSERFHDIELKNFNMISKQQCNGLHGKLPHVKFIDYSNLDASPDFKAFYILGKTDIPGLGADVPFEVQFNQAGAELAPGMANHEVYELRQVFSAVSNLYGFFFEDYLVEMVKKVSRNTGINEKEIMDHLLKGSIKEITKKGGRRRFMANTQVGHFANSTVIPGGVKGFLSGEYRAAVESDNALVDGLDAVLDGMKMSLHGTFVSGSSVSDSQVDADRAIQRFYDLLNKIKAGKLSSADLRAGKYPNFKA